MILFLCLMAMLVAILLIAIPITGAIGGVGLLLFAEPIICIFIIWWIISKVFNK